jgi:hypothetical protein
MTTESQSPILSSNSPINRRSSNRLSGSTSPQTSLVSGAMPPPATSRHSRAMTPGELHNAMEQEQEVFSPD